MKNLKAIALAGLGFTLLLSCSKQSEICQCTDLATELMKGSRESGYDKAFEQKFNEEHKADKAMCEKLNQIKDKASQEKMRKEAKECSGYAAYKEETIKSLEHLKKEMPEFAKEIDETIKKMKAE